MARQTINTGSALGDRTGDNGRVAFTKVNENFAELYIGGANAGDIRLYGTNTTPGTTDMTAAFVACLAANGYADLQPETYSVTGIALESGQALRGAGRGQTIIKLADAANAHVITAPDASDILIQDLTIDGNQANQSVGSGNNWRCVYAIGTCHRWLVRNVEIKNAVDHGFMLTGDAADYPGLYSTIENCLAHDCGSAAHISGGGAGGDGYNGGTNTTNWLHCDAYDNYLGGFKGGGTFEFCDAANDGTNFKVGSEGTTSDAHLYIGCRALGGGGAGFRFESPQGTIRLIDCVACEHDYSGVNLLNGAGRITIQGCYIYNNGGETRASTDGVDGISLMSTGATAPSQVIIDGCQIWDDQGSPTQEYGIYIDDPTTDVLITSNNIIQDNEFGPLYLTSASKSDNVRVGAFIGSTAAYRNITAAPVTGTLAATDLMSQTIEADEFFNGKVIRGVVRGSTTGTAGTKVIRLHVGPTSVIISNQASGDEQVWSATFTVARVGGTSVTTTVNYFEDGGTSASTIINDSIAIATDVTIKVTGTLGNTGDTITQTFMSLTAEM